MNEESNVSNQVYSGLGAIVSVLVFASIIVGVLLLARIIFLFFGDLKSVAGYDQVVKTTETFIGPLKAIEPVKTPYEGVFDIAATGALLGVMLLEFILAGVRDFFRKQSARALQPPPQTPTTVASTGLGKGEEDLIKK